jgi:3-methylcrotonyl-CoA carboxylase alpha subunit
VIVSTNPKQSHLVDMEVIDASNNTSIKTFTAVESHIDQDGLMVSAIDSKTLKSNVVLHDEDVVVFDEFGRTTFKLPTPNYILGGGESHGAGSVKTPMPCKISQVLVKPGQVIEKGTALIILEAMKMEHVIKAPVAGTIDQVLYAVGDLVAENKNLVTFADDEQK